MYNFSMPVHNFRFSVWYHCFICSTFRRMVVVLFINLMKWDVFNCGISVHAYNVLSYSPFYYAFLNPPLLTFTTLLSLLSYVFLEWFHPFHRCIQSTLITFSFPPTLSSLPLCAGLLQKTPFYIPSFHRSNFHLSLAYFA
jgi:hypothetical protein